MRRLPQGIHKTMEWLVERAPVGNRFFMRVYDSILWRITDPIPVRTYFGAAMLCDPRDLIQSMIVHFGVWEPNVSGIFETLLSEGDVVVDVGANVGYDSLLAATLVGPSGKVISIEASPSIFEKLERNAGLNPELPVVCVNVAASDRTETISLFHGPLGNSGMATTLPSRGSTLECEVQARPLTSIIGDELLSRVRVVKIDIEGGEIPVVRHLLDSIARFSDRIAIVVEISPNGDWQELFHRFRALGFFAYRLHNPYGRDYYLESHATLVRPERIETLPREQNDVLFTRSGPLELGWPPPSRWRTWRLTEPTQGLGA